MVVSRLVPYSTVDRWSIQRLRRGGSDLRNFPIQEFLRRHFTKPPSLGELRGSTFDEQEIDRALSDRSVREELLELVPNIPI